MEEYYSKPMMVVKPGGNRKEKIKDLQDKFKKGRGGLPSAIELPVVGRAQYDDDDPTEEELKERALMKVPQKHLMLTTKPNHNKENEEKNQKPMTRNVRTGAYVPGKGRGREIESGRFTMEGVS